MNICHTGGCKGADQIFGEVAFARGDTVYNYSFLNHHIPANVKGHIVRLNAVGLAEADHHLRLANKQLKRGYFPYPVEYTNNLLRRNYYQVKKTQRIYAVSYLDEFQNVGGGTGWAVTMGINLGVKEVYVFDWKQDKWFEYVFLNTWQETTPPTPHGDYTGIGSHDLPQNGAAAIRALYEETNN